MGTAGDDWGLRGITLTLTLTLTTPVATKRTRANTGETNVIVLSRRLISGSSFSVKHCVRFRGFWDDSPIKPRCKNHDQTLGGGGGHLLASVCMPLFFRFDNSGVGPRFIRHAWRTEYARTRRRSESWCNFISSTFFRWQ